VQKLFQSVAFVQKSGAPRSRLLLRQQDGTGYLQFIVGERIEKESFRETAIREVAWQLNLDPKRDFIVSSISRLSMEYVSILPGDDRERHVAVSFYPVHIYRRAVLGMLDSDPVNHWVSEAEICSGITVGNVPIDPLIVHWINKWQLLQPWKE
jgi:hypothetical protein